MLLLSGTCILGLINIMVGVCMMSDALMVSNIESIVGGTSLGGDVRIHVLVLVGSGSMGGRGRDTAR